MRKAAIRGQALVCVILSFIGLVNYGVLFWMSGKTKQKKLRVAGVVLFILCICSFAGLGSIENDGVEAVITWVCMGTIIAPTIINCANLKTFINCQNLWSLIEKNQIRIHELSEIDYANIQLHVDEATLKNSKRLFGNKNETVLRAIQFKERENREILENKKREAERAKAEAKRMEIEMAQAEADRVRAEAEAKKIETERVREENKRIEKERIKAENEKIRVEAQRLETEKTKAEAERMQAEVELKRLDLERIRGEKDNRLEKEQKERRIEGKAEPDSLIAPIGNNRIVDINLCTEQELSLIPGIGIILAKKAIHIRNEKGCFDSVDEFIEMVGIRKSNEAIVRKSLICEQSEQNVENNIKKRSRKIDL